MPILYEDVVRGAPRDALSVPSPREDVLRETFAQAFEENPIKAVQRWRELKDAEQEGPMLSADVARTKLKEAGMERDLAVSDAGITQAALDTLMWRKKIERRRQETFARSEGGFVEGAQRFGIAALTTLADPISMGLNFVPIVGQARYARWLSRAPNLAGRLAVRAQVGAVEGAAGAALAEIPIYQMRTQEQADYDAVDSLMNVAFGGVIGSGLHTTVGSVGELIARRLPSRELAPRIEPTIGEPASRSTEALPADVQRAVFEAPRMDEIVEKLPGEVRQAALRAAVGQAVEGRQIDVESIVTARPDEVIGFTTARGSDYEVGQGGVTTRNKAARPDVGHEGDFGPQPASEATFYVRPDDAIKLGEFQSQGGPKKAIAMTRDGRIGVKYLEGKDAGLFERRTVVPIERGPAVGLTPVELWKRGERVHFGNEITAVKTVRQQTSSQRAVTRVAAEYTAASERAEVTLARDIEPNTEANLKAAEEEADLATADAKSLAERLGLKFDDADINAVNEAVEKAERWARAAELATVCLVRGG